VADLSKYTKDLSDLFSTSGNILLISHINPDGDAIGSQLALYHFLTSKGCRVSMMTPNYLQEFLKWMTSSDQIEVYIRDRRRSRQLISQSDLIVFLDFNHSGRLGEAEEFVKASSARKILIDHHLDPEDFADLAISDTSKCSTSELVHLLVTDLNGGVPFRSQPYSEALYVGIITDTGNFEHGNYTPNTLRIVADLMESGIDKDKILDLIYNNFSADRMRLQGFALNSRMTVLPEYNTAYIHLSKEDLKEYNHVKGDTEGFVNMPLSISGIRFSAMFIEKDGFIKLSFRSKGKFPSNEFASLYFSGGGHLNASGGEYKGGLDESIRYFLEKLRDNLWRFQDEE
jgi:bifunctional oligoribonuclease and PAP phosphatase NrnA